MTRSEMGQVMAYLLRSRRLDSTAVRRKTRVDERGLALVLRDASLEEKAELEALLRAFGFDLAHYTDFNTQGIAPGGHVFLLTRRLDETSDLFGERWIDERMQLRNDSVTERRIWFAQIWFILFYLFYTRRERVATEVSRYVETTFSRADLAATVRDYINNHVRKLGHDVVRDDVIYRCLTSETGMQIEQYCERFLGLMIDGGMVDRLGEDRYRQSLLSAAEMKNNYVQGLEPWIRTIGGAGNPVEDSRSLLIKVGESSDTAEL